MLLTALALDLVCTWRELRLAVDQLRTPVAGLMDQHAQKRQDRTP